jgi:5'-nucleotidase/UDP-sugar diphosphatase
VTESQNSIDIYYSASLDGNLDGCYCGNPARAGLVKRACYIHNLSGRDRSILVDAGDLLSSDPDELLAEHILAVYDELDYDAVAVGEQDFSNGAIRLFEYGRTIPAVAHNLALYSFEDGWALFSPEPLVLERAGLRIGIFALIDPRTVSDFQPHILERIRIEDPAETARKLVARLDARRAALTILLYHGFEADVPGLLENAPGIDVVLLAHEQKLLEGRRFGDSLVFSPGEQGNRLGKLRISIKEGRITDYDNSFILFDYSRDPDDPTVRSRIEHYRQQMLLKMLHDSGGY